MIKKRLGYFDLRITKSHHFLKKIFALGIVLYGLLFILKDQASLSVFCEVGLNYFVPGIGLLFLISFYLSLKFEKTLDQPPLMIFLLSMVIKMLGSLTIFLVYLLKHLGPDNEGAMVFVLTYLAFEFLEIKRFLAILRPDSRENTPE
jgi:hypothetical protein